MSEVYIAQSLDPRLLIMQPTFLTEEFVRDLRWQGKAFVIRDVEVKGLMVVVNKTTKSYKVQRDLWVGARGRRKLVKTVGHTLGSTQDFTIEEARVAARQVINTIKRGVDPNSDTIYVDFESPPMRFDDIVLDIEDPVWDMTPKLEPAKGDERPYVYILSVGARVLYVGEGKAQRCVTSMLEKATGARAESIQARLMYHNTKTEALAAEWLLIKFFGLETLVNRMPGQGQALNTLRAAWSQEQLGAFVAAVQRFALELPVGAPLPHGAALGAAGLA